MSSVAIMNTLFVLLAVLACATAKPQNQYSQGSYNRNSGNFNRNPSTGQRHSNQQQHQQHNHQQQQQQQQHQQQHHQSQQHFSHQRQAQALRAPLLPPHNPTQFSQRLQQPFPNAIRPFVPITSYSNDVSYDGSYSYAYTTGDGQQQQAQGYLKNAGLKDLEAQSVQGSYSYTSPEGQLITVTYIADENGAFVSTLTSVRSLMRVHNYVTVPLFPPQDSAPRERICPHRPRSRRQSRNRSPSSHRRNRFRRSSTPPTTSRASSRVCRCPRAPARTTTVSARRPRMNNTGPDASIPRAETARDRSNETDQRNFTSND
uniref:Uncharacterized protein n=1 Tax=Anopheles atroparvus TaxID=41427 RepID=A0AAG5CXV8_ANOAO